VDLAAEMGLTLVGFLRGTSMNVYTRPDRLGLDLAGSSDRPRTANLL
jgi:FdhD protein